MRGWKALLASNLLEVRLWSFAMRRIEISNDGKKKLVDSKFSLGVLGLC